MFDLDGMATAYVCVLFGGYLLLWYLARRRVQRDAGIDPEVMGKASGALQRYLFRITQVLTALTVVLIAAHALGPRDVSWLERFPPLDARWWDHLGLAAGMIGLAVCRIAQRSMGTAWRVGLDEQTAAPLITGGIYGYIRNPTYLGLFLLLAGLWIIWPTPFTTIYALVFVFFLEVQVRCEEEHLLRMHGDVYRAYSARTKRYLPWVY